MSKARKKNRKEQKAKRKAARANRKERRFSARPGQLIKKTVERRQDRKDKELDAEIELNKMKVEQELEQSRLLALQEAEQNAPDTTNELQNAKAGRYLAKRGVRPYKDPSLRAAQVVDERNEQIQERLIPEVEEVNNDISIPDEEKADWIPDEEDIHEDILEEEFEQASFDGYDKDHADYLDEDTLGVLFKVGKSAADKYREKQFAKGKKAFGQTKEQWEAAQKEKAKGDTVLNAAQAAAEEEIKRQKIKEYTPHMIVGAVLLTIVLYAVYKSGKKGS